MTTTAHRPAPLPPRPGQPMAAFGAVRRPQLAGVAGWSKTYLDRSGKPQSSEYDVPVNADGYRTEHIRYACRGHIEVAGVRQDCDQVAWLAAGENARYCPDHGCQLTPDGQAERASLLPWGQIRRAVEPSARPWWVLLAELAAGVGVHAGHVPWLVPLASTPVLAGGAYAGVQGYLTRRAIRNRKLERGQRDGRRVETIRRRARVGLYTGAGAGGWLTLAAAVDPMSRPGAATLGVSLAALFATTAPTWFNYAAANRNRPEPEAPAQVEHVDGSAASVVDRAAQRDADDWASEVATPGVLPNTFVDISTWKTDPGGRRMVIRARKGALTDEKIRIAVPIIAAAFEVKSDTIGWVCEYEGTPKSALLLVQPNSPLNDNQTWEPIDVVDIDNAVAHIGTRIDGSTLVTRLWTPGWGAPSRAIYGTKGSGKTEYLRLLLLAMLKAQVVGPNGPRRLIAPFLHDPKRGMDYGAFRRQVCGFSNSNECLHMIIDALVREMDRRYDTTGMTVWVDDKGREQEGETAFDPRIHGPVISLVIDEFHEPAKDQAFLAKLEPMARKMRAAGIEIVYATHAATLGDTGTQVVRDMASGGEATLFRTTMGLNAALATGGTLVGDPRALPRKPGMNLHASGEENTMQARMAYVPRDELYDMLYDDDNVSLTRPVEWPQETLDAFGPEFVEWMRACQARRPGEPAPPTPKPFGGATRSSASGAAEKTEKPGAVDALRQILFEADRPLRRDEIATHPLWKAGGWLVTSTLGAALTTLKKAGEIGGPHGLHELMPAVRERMRAERDEAAE